MKKSLLVGLGITIAVVIIVAIIFSGSYNDLVTNSENAKSKWGVVQSQLQRRSDLIPNLVSTVKGYAEHEQEIFTAVADARGKLLGAGSAAEAGEANAELSSALSRLIAISESYPELKANTSFIQLQDELAGTENRIQRAREEYNDGVTEYNLKVKRFPGILFAQIYGFTPMDYFEAESNKQGVPNVSF